MPAKPDATQPYYARGREIFARPRPGTRPNSFVSGFLVCTVSEYVDEPDKAAADIAAALNRDAAATAT